MRILIAVVSLVYALIARAEESFLFANIKNDNASAVLVLAPGMNTNGAFSLTESSLREFAKRNNLGIIALNYSSSKEDLYYNREGYYYPNKGSGQALLDEIKRVYGKDLPIVLYGFSG